MKNSELKAMLQNAYAVNPTEKENCFVRKYERRHMRFRDVLVLELKYMGIKSVAAGVILCAVLFFFARQGDVRVKWMASSLLPLFALLPSAIVGSSERYGMQELEASSRFSLQLIRMARMLIWGTLSLIIILLGTIFFQNYFETNILITGCFVGFPYLFSVWGCLLITRKWHSKDNIYGCVGVTVLSCMMPLFIELLKLWEYVTKPAVSIAVIVILIAAVRESILYVRDGEDLSWNLC